MARNRKSTYTLLGVPDGFGTLLLAIALVLAMGPYFPGADFGVLKVPLFEPAVARTLKIAGPAVLLLLLLLFIPVWASRPTSAVNVAADRGVDATIGRQTGLRAPGRLRITATRVSQDPAPSAPGSMPGKCIVDFWVDNEGGSEVSITSVYFDVIDTARGQLIKGGFPRSETYDLDLSDVRVAGQKVECRVSQRIAPGKTDRFAVRLTAAKLGSGVFAAWKLKPTLVTNYGPVSAEPVEVWLPYHEGDADFELLKYVEAMERSARDAAPDDLFDQHEG